MSVWWLLACTGKPADTGEPVDSALDTRDSAADSAGDTAPDTGDSASTGPDCLTGVETGASPFVDAVESFTPGEGAGYGQACLPDVVYGPPHAPGDGGGSLDVLALGVGGEIVVSFVDGFTDVEGPDLRVFENAFVGWYEPAYVAASEDGVTWSEWPCDPTDAAGLYPGCAGVGVVYSNPDNGVDPTDPAAGGDAFDLADLGLTHARYVRVRDAGLGAAGGTASGFDLDAMAVVGQ